MTPAFEAHPDELPVPCQAISLVGERIAHLVAANGRD